MGLMKGIAPTNAGQSHTPSHLKQSNSRFRKLNIGYQGPRDVVVRGEQFQDLEIISMVERFGFARQVLEVKMVGDGHTKISTCFTSLDES